MAFDFPNSPTVGQIFQPSTGMPTYRWDGVRWTTQGVQPTHSPVYLDVASLFTAQQSFVPVALFDAANISWDVSTRQKAKVTLGGNRTLNAVTNAVEGTTYFLWVYQDATGSRTLSFATSGVGSFDFGGQIAPALSTAPNKADLLTFEAVNIGGTLKLRYTGIAVGFA
jgi:hypothetical protein